MQRPAREEHLPFRAAFLQTGLPCSSADKESACNAGDPGLIPGWERSPGEGIGYPFQYSGGSATHSSILAWRISWIA